MSEVHTTLIILKNHIHTITGLPVYILDSEPAAIDSNVIYIVSPEGTTVNRTHMIGTSSFLDYTVTIYQVKHIQDITRQKDIKDNIVETYSSAEESMLGRCFDRFKGYKRIGTANIYECNYGTATWVVNTKLYTSYELTLSIKDIVDD